MQEHPPILNLLNQAYEIDPLVGKMLQAIRHNGSLTEITVPEYTEQGGKVLYRGKCYVLEGDQLRLHLIQEHHDTTLARHSGRAKTFDLLDRQYYWKDMRKQVDQYIRNCHNCQLFWTSKHIMFGVL